MSIFHLYASQLTVSQWKVRRHVNELLHIINIYLLVKIKNKIHRISHEVSFFYTSDK